MSFSPLDSRLYGPLFATPALSELLSDQAQVRRMVQVEVALARVQADLGLIPQEAATEIGQAGGQFEPDWGHLRAGLANDGVPVVALLEQLRRNLGAAGQTYLHWGATTQDIVDTALILVLREALEDIEADLKRLIAALAALAEQHAHTLMAGRTHSQQALPTTFGLKVAGWLAPLLRDLERLAQLRPRLLVVQFGGAAGTLAALGGNGLRVCAALARELDLAEPLTPWHTQRDNLAELASWLSLVTGSLGKMAQDIILLAQSEVGEVQESSDPSKGGSSTMPQKSNPIQSELVLAAARMNATLLSGVHQAQVQEHERGTHGWQLEWLTLPQMLGLTAGAVSRSLTLAQEIKVDAAQMQRNLTDSLGLMLAEAYTFALTPQVGRMEAKRLVQQAVKITLRDRRPLSESIRQVEGIPTDLAPIHEKDYLGEHSRLIAQVLEAAKVALR